MNKNEETVHEVIYFKGESEGIVVEGAFQYVNEFHENVLGFCNNIYNAEGGTHLTGLQDHLYHGHQQLCQGAGHPEGEGREFHRRGCATTA